MAGDDFCTHARPADPKLAEDRPRGGGPEDVRAGRRRGDKPLWMVIGLIIIVAVLLVVLLPPVWSWHGRGARRLVRAPRLPHP